SRMSGACFMTMWAKLRAMKPVPDRPMRGSGRFLLVILFGGGGNRPVPQETGPAGVALDDAEIGVEAVAGCLQDASRRIEQGPHAFVVRCIDAQQGDGAKTGAAFSRERQYGRAAGLLDDERVADPARDQVARGLAGFRIEDANL